MARKKCTFVIVLVARTFVETFRVRDFAASEETECPLKDPGVSFSYANCVVPQMASPVDVQF